VCSEHYRSLLAYTCSIRIFVLGFKYKLARIFYLGFNFCMALVRIDILGFKAHVATRIFGMGFKLKLARTNFGSHLYIGVQNFSGSHLYFSMTRIDILVYKPNMARIFGMGFKFLMARISGMGSKHFMARTGNMDFTPLVADSHTFYGFQPYIGCCLLFFVWFP